MSRSNLLTLRVFESARILSIQTGLGLVLHVLADDEIAAHIGPLRELVNPSKNRFGPTDGAAEARGVKRGISEGQSLHSDVQA